MTDSNDAPTNKPSVLRDVSGTTVALTSLALMGAAAVVSAPLWFWYRRKRRRTDALVAQTPADALLPASADTPSEVPADPGKPPAGRADDPGPR